MKNFAKLIGIIALVAVIGFSFTACKEDEDDNPFIGTWTGTVNGESMTMVITANSWSASFPNHSSYNTSGTYTYNGNTATFITSDGDAGGTGTISGNTIIYTSGIDNARSGTLTKSDNNN